MISLDKGSSLFEKILLGSPSQRMVLVGIPSMAILWTVAFTCRSFPSISISCHFKAHISPRRSPVEIQMIIPNL